MKKTSTFLYVLHFPFLVSFPDNEENEIPNIQRSISSNNFSYLRNTEICTLNAFMHSNTSPGNPLPGLPEILDVATLLYKSVNLKLSTFLKLIQVLCVNVITHGRFLHSTFMPINQ